MEKIQERALKFLLNDSMSSYASLLEKACMSTLFLGRLRLFAIEVFKCINGLNPGFMNTTFKQKQNKYDFRDDCIVALPHFNSIMYGKKSFKYYGAHIWNHVPPHFKHAESVKGFKRCITTWEGPICQCNMCQILF